MGDFNGNNYDDKFIGNLVNFVAGENFQNLFENFFTKHALIFEDADEHKLEYYDLFLKFKTLFDDKLSEFREQEGISEKEFMERCREASSQDAKVMHYITILLSSAEYETFVKLMKIMR